MDGAMFSPLTSTSPCFEGVSGRESTTAPRIGRRGLRLATTVSVAFHSLLALALYALSTASSHLPDNRPLAEIPVVVLPEEGSSLSLAAETEPVTSCGPLAEPAAGPIRVGPLALNSEFGSSSDEEAPRVSGVLPVSRPAGIADKASQDAAGADPSFFGVAVQARNVVFLVDRSLSMGLNGGLDAAKDELRSCLERLPASTRVQVLFYNRSVESVPTPEADRLLANDEQTRQAVERLAARIRPEGGTDHAKALRAALALRCDAILLLTDGDDMTANQIRTLTELNRGRSAIHALEWGRLPEVSEPLQALARQNRGTYRKLTGQRRAWNE
jgi:hypothetical protein